MSKRPLIDVAAVATPSSSRKISASSRVELPKYSIDSPTWTDETTTCLSLGLSPIHPDHQPVVCKNCIWFWEKKLKFGKRKHDSAKRSQRSACDRPFAFRDGAEPGKQHARERIRELLSASDPSDDRSPEFVEVPCFTPVPKRTKTSPAGCCDYSTPSGREKLPRGSPRMCDSRGRLSPAFTAKIESQLHGRKYLEANELDLLISLLQIYSSACVEQVSEQQYRKEIPGLLSQALCLLK